MSHVDLIIQLCVDTTDQTINQPQVLFIDTIMLYLTFKPSYSQKTKKYQPNTPIRVIKDGIAHKLRSKAVSPASRVLQGQFGDVLALPEY